MPCLFSAWGAEVVENEENYRKMGKNNAKSLTKVRKLLRIESLGRQQNLYLTIKL
jgi:hypothetical protein